jgi:hypothetical protein
MNERLQARAVSAFVLAGLSLALTGRASAQSGTLATARVSGPAYVRLIAAEDQGSRLLPPADNPAELIDLFTGTDWSLLESGEVRVTRGGQALFTMRHWPNTERNWFLIHLVERRPEAVLTMNGALWRESGDPSRGAFEIFMQVMPRNDSRIAIIYFWVPLTFDRAQEPGRRR